MFKIMSPSVAAATQDVAMRGVISTLTEAFEVSPNAQAHWTRPARAYKKLVRRTSVHDYVKYYNHERLQLRLKGLSPVGYLLINTV